MATRTVTQPPYVPPAPRPSTYYLRTPKLPLEETFSMPEDLSAKPPSKKIKTLASTTAPSAGNKQDVAWHEQSEGIPVQTHRWPLAPAFSQVRRTDTRCVRASPRHQTDTSPVRPRLNFAAILSPSSTRSGRECVEMTGRNLSRGWRRPIRRMCPAKIICAELPCCFPAQCR